MEKQKEIKELLLDHMCQQLDFKIETARQAIVSAKEARNEDTKSSAGDKFETGRVMMQLEIDKNELLLNKAVAQKQELLQINHEKGTKKVEYGSLVITNLGSYFLSFGFGKIEVKKQIYYAISFAAPIGMLLKGKGIGEKFSFQGREYFIKDIY